MKTVSEVLKQVTDKQIRIDGHTDNVPIGAGLKDRFPSSVVRCLIDEGGLAPELLTVAGHADRNQLPPTTQRKVAPKIGGLRLPVSGRLEGHRRGYSLDYDDNVVTAKGEGPMIYQAKSFENLKGLRDFSDRLLETISRSIRGT